MAIINILEKSHKERFFSVHLLSDIKKIPIDTTNLCYCLTKEIDLCNSTRVTQIIFIMFVQSFVRFFDKYASE